MPVKISIIIPTYQRPALLTKCMTALVSQDFSTEEYEIIIVTDGPDEQTITAIQRLYKNKPSPALFYCSLPCKKGPAAARNAGWKQAKGSLILFTDDDCIPSHDWVKNYYNAFEFYAQTLIAFSGKIIVPRSPNPTDFELNTANLETAGFVTANCACSKEALEMVNGFDEAFTMAWREDSDLEFKLLKEGIPITKIEEALVVHPARKAAWGVSLKEQKKSMFDALLFKKHPRLYKKRIYTPVLWNYILMVILLLAFFMALVFQQKLIALICLLCWIFLMGLFVAKRLSHASHSFKHILEMVATSIMIPFFSLFWNLYGAWKFKALHL